MTRRLVFSGSELDNLQDIFDFIATDRPRRARSDIDEIRAACRNLCDLPMMGVEGSELS